MHACMLLTLGACSIAPCAHHSTEAVATAWATQSMQSAEQRCVGAERAAGRQLREVRCPHSPRAPCVRARARAALSSLVLVEELLDALLQHARVDVRPPDGAGVRLVVHLRARACMCVQVCVSSSSAAQHSTAHAGRAAAPHTEHDGLALYECLPGTHTLRGMHAHAVEEAGGRQAKEGGVPSTSACMVGCSTTPHASMRAGSGPLRPSTATCIGLAAPNAQLCPREACQHVRRAHAASLHTCALRP